MGRHGEQSNNAQANVANGEVVGAIRAVVAHPTSANTVYVGSVNGGVWRTTNATAAKPAWTPLTDTQRGSRSAP